MRIQDASQVGAELRRRRSALRLSQQAVADAIGVNRRVVGELERGKTSVRFEIVLAAAQAVGLDVELHARER